MTDTIRDLLISLSSHMAYMQGQLEAGLVLYDPEHYYWYRESVLLRQKVTDALADEPAVPQPQPPAEGEVEELVRLLGSMAAEAELADQVHDASVLDRAAELLQRLSPPQPVPVSERLPGQEDCDEKGYCWRWNTISGVWSRQHYSRHWYEFETHWLPAHALPVPGQEVAG